MAAMRPCGGPVRSHGCGTFRVGPGIKVAVAAAVAVIARCPVVFTAWHMPGPRAPLVSRAAASGKGPSDKDPPGVGEMTLEEEYKSGKTLEAELAEVMEARSRGSDIRREPAIEAKNDMAVAAQGALRQVQDTVSGVNLKDGPTLFWAVLIGLVILGWLLPLFR
mmetsp:Transcript_52605/g.118492  ORF Transcript_52605/g.118492 Transcript_52605/m.118492 type:complete len:164 (-) Transcript_52605:85-576(-)